MKGTSARLLDEWPLSTKVGIIQLQMSLNANFNMPQLETTREDFDRSGRFWKRSEWILKRFIVPTFALRILREVLLNSSTCIVLMLQMPSMRQYCNSKCRRNFLKFLPIITNNVDVELLDHWLILTDTSLRNYQISLLLNRTKSFYNLHKQRLRNSVTNQFGRRLQHHTSNSLNKYATTATTSTKNRRLQRKTSDD